MADAKPDQDPPATDGVLGNLPASRPQRRSARRAPSGTAKAAPKARTATAKPKATSAKTTAKAGAGTRAKAPAKAAPKRAAAAKATTKPAAGAKPKRAAPQAAPAPTASSGADRARPVPKAPRSGWATPEPTPSPKDQALRDVLDAVGAVANRGESIVRGVLRRITPR
ncbi:hypothetical protein [Patulibacter defluvii]|uniref:hypothetical protein n=1 Tax=Patulibacter defluvii TaxID=3095358 RepID=UPI002A75FD7F|nr:hypothetical protein [Patulibacter sp. DM4]